RARASARLGVHSLICVSLASSLLDFSPDSHLGRAGTVRLADHSWALAAYISRLPTRACAMVSGESTSATECQLAACFSQPGGLTPNFLARTEIMIFVFISPKPGSLEMRFASSSPSPASRHTAPASPP